MNLAGDGEKAFIFEEIERKNVFMESVAKPQMVLSYKYLPISITSKRKGKKKKRRGVGNRCYFIF